MNNINQIEACDADIKRNDDHKGSHKKVAHNLNKIDNHWLSENSSAEDQKDAAQHNKAKETGKSNRISQVFKVKTLYPAELLLST